MITNFAIPTRAREALGRMAVRDLLTTQGYEDAAVGEHVLEGLAALQLVDVGTVIRAVIRAVTRATARVVNPEVDATHRDRSRQGGAKGDITTATGTPDTGITRTSSADNITSTENETRR